MNEILMKLSCLKNVIKLRHCSSRGSRRNGRGKMEKKKRKHRLSKEGKPVKCVPSSGKFRMTRRGQTNQQRPAPNKQNGES